MRLEMLTKSLGIDLKISKSIFFQLKLD